METGTGHSPAAGPSLASAAQASILAAHAETWGIQTLIRLATALPGNAIVVTTSPPGLSAWIDLTSRLPTSLAERLATATEIEYRGWCMRSPDEGHRLHAVLWSWIKAPLPPQRRPDFASFPIAASADYWVLRYGHTTADEGGHSADLFSWNGALTTRLATGITERFRPKG